MKQKMYYITCGYLLTFANLLLIGTRFNLVGLGFGLAAMGFFIKSLTIKQDKWLKLLNS